MKTKLFVLVFMTFSLFCGSVFAAVEHGSICKKNVQLSLNNVDEPGYFVDFKLVTIGSMTYARIDGTGYTLANTGWASQLRYEGEKQCPVENRTGNTSIWSFATPSPQSSSIHVMQEEENNFYVTPNFTYNKTVKNSPVDGDITSPVLSSAIASNSTDNTITLTMSATDGNDFFYYISSLDVEIVSFSDELTISGLMPGTDFSFTVIAIDFNGNESNPIVVNTTTTGTRPAFNPADNLALNKMASASMGVASRGNDGELTRWRSNGDPNWWMVNLGADYAITTVIIKMDGDGGARNAVYDIEVSLTGKEDSWTKVVSEAVIPLGSGQEFNQHVFVATPAHFVRYNGIRLNAGNSWDHNFAEFEVYGSGYYDPNAVSNLASVAVQDATVIEGEEVALSIVALDENDGPFLNAEVSEITIESGTANGLDVIERSDVWYAQGLIEGVYIIKVTMKDKDDESITVFGTATVTVTEARKLGNISIDLAQQYKDFKLSAKNPTELVVTCKDQYNGEFVTPDNFTSNVANGTITYNEGRYYYTPNTIGYVELTLSSNIVTSNNLNLDIVANGQNIVLNKSTGLTANDGALNLGNAFDDKYSTVCQLLADGADDREAWLLIDLEYEYDINMIDVRFEGSRSENYTIQYAVNGTNDTDFQTIYTVTGNNATVNQHYGVADKAKYIKLHSTSTKQGWGLKIRELRVFGTPAGGTGNNTVSPAEPQISIFPNPVTDVLNIKGDVQAVAMYSLQGQLVLSEADVNTINVASFNKGMYLVKVTDIEGNVHTEKIQVR